MSWTHISPQGELTLYNDMPPLSHAWACKHSRLYMNGLEPQIAVCRSCGWQYALSKTAGRELYFKSMIQTLQIKIKRTLEYRLRGLDDNQLDELLLDIKSFTRYLMQESRLEYDE